MLSVIKKGAGGLTKKSDDKLGTPYDALAVGLRGYGEARDPQIPAPSTKAAQSTRPQKEMSGSLLYLTRVITSAELSQLHSPVGISLSTDAPDVGKIAWTTCTVTLKSNKLVLSSFTAEMHLMIHEILFADFANIRSRSSQQLSADEAQLLEETSRFSEGGNDVFKVFEIQFAGRPKEMFAARSVRERAGWISAIW